MRTAMNPLFAALAVLLFTIFVLAPNSVNAIALPFSAEEGLVVRSANALSNGPLDLTRLTKRKGSKVSKPSKTKSKKKKFPKWAIAVIIILVLIIIVAAVAFLLLRSRRAKKARVTGVQ